MNEPVRFSAEIRALEWYRTNVPCMEACPVHTDSGRYVQLIAEGKLEEAFLVARSPNPLASICGRICAAPCEDACRRGWIDEAVTIRPLKRFVCEAFGAESARPDSYRALMDQASVASGREFPGCQRPWSMPELVRSAKREPDIVRKVVVIGSGSAGFGCAH